MTGITTDLIGTLVAVWHEGTHEIVRLPVEGVTRKLILVRWGMSGLYEIDIKTAQIRACSIAARRKGSMVQWHVRDMLNLRQAVRVHLDGEDRRKIADRLRAEHEARMPVFQKKGESS